MKNLTLTFVVFALIVFPMFFIRPGTAERGVIGSNIDYYSENPNELLAIVIVLILAYWGFIRACRPVLRKRFAKNKNKHS